MKKSLILLCGLVFLMSTCVALAQDEEEEYAHDALEIDFFGGVDGPTGDMLDWQDSLGAKTGFDFGFDVGYFLKEALVAGVGFRYSQYSIDAAEEDLVAATLKHRSYNPNLYLKYLLFPVSDFSPYVKVGAGLTFLKFTTWVENPNGDRYRQIAYDPALSWSVGAGGFMYTADYGGFFVEGNYHYVSAGDVEAEYEGNTYVFGDNLALWDIRAGVRILVGSGD
jgi:hypothetical protein